MAKATWKGQILAECEDDKTEEVEGNIYFPPDSLNNEFFKESEHKTTCPWKGEASYFNIEVNNEINENAAWFYPEPKEKANNIKGFVAFWKGVEIT